MRRRVLVQEDPFLFVSMAFAENPLARAKRPLRREAALTW